MENLRKRIDVRLVTDKKKLSKMVSKTEFFNSEIYGEFLVAVQKIKECLTLDRPASVGMCILDLSKTLMYDFHYNTTREMYGDNAKLLFTDTDSLCYEIQTKDVYKDLCLTLVIIPKTVHILPQQIRKCQVNSKIKALESQWVDL